MGEEHIMKRIYIAGPYTQGDQAQNVRRAIDAAEAVMQAGFAPYVPHMSHFHHMIHAHFYEMWMRIGKVWLMQCDAVLRLAGLSPGADREVALARKLGIPVFYSVSELVEAMR